MAKDKTKESAEDLKEQKVEINTHHIIDKVVCGEVAELKMGYAKLEFKANKDMIVDEYNLIHSGFVYNAAANAAMFAVNEPFSELVSSEAKYLAPIESGKVITFEATASHLATRTRDVIVVGRVGEIKIFEGEFKIVILDKHPLRIKLSDN